MKKKLALLLVLAMGLSLTACAKKSESKAAADMVYAVEAGSAGEAAAREWLCRWRPQS